jgi:hypothetical protein
MAVAKVNYQYQGAFDRAIFRTEFDRQFSKNGHYNAAAIPDMLVLLGMIEQDAQITDIRWSAYMLATAFKETISPTLRQYPLRRKGKLVVDKATGAPVMRNTYPWLMQMRPVDEVGKGHTRQYQEAAKVKRLADGRIQITEQDGDQFVLTSAAAPFKVAAKGAIVKYTDDRGKSKFEGGGIMGTKPGDTAQKVYADDDGAELAYFGRGYVQLTWWENYVKAGERLGRGFDLLLNPEIAKEPAVAYRLMSDGMYRGAGFANGKSFSMYFSGDNKNYTAARAMVNGDDCAAEIAKYAEAFEGALLASKKQ